MPEYSTNKCPLCSHHSTLTDIFGKSLVVQLLELCASTAGGPGLITGRRTKISQVLQCGQKKKKNHHIVCQKLSETSRDSKSSNQERKMRYIQQEPNIWYHTLTERSTEETSVASPPLPYSGFLPAIHFKSVKVLCL